MIFVFDIHPYGTGTVQNEHIVFKKWWNSRNQKDRDDKRRITRNCVATLTQTEARKARESRKVVGRVTATVVAAEWEIDRISDSIDSTCHAINIGNPLSVYNVMYRYFSRLLIF